MQNIATIIILLIIVAVLALVARRVAIPYPTLMVLAGLAIWLVPGLPHVALNPEIVMLVFLPPLLYSAAWYTTWHEFRREIGPISRLAIGLVLVTMGAVAVVGHYVVGLPWAAAFALGAIVSPPDAIAATAIAGRMRLPRRIVTILEGESLVNDATALIALRYSVAAALAGSFSLTDSLWEFLLAGTGGVLLGLAVGWIVTRLHERINDPLVETVVTLLTPYVVFLPAELLHLSAVLAVVTCGLFVSQRSSLVFSPNLRLYAYAVWDVWVFLLNGIVFILIGLQLPRVIELVAAESVAQPLLAAAVVSAVVIAVRVIWVFGNVYVVYYLIGSKYPTPPWGQVAVVAWAGMRGVVSLAAAQALPLMSGAERFPGRELIIFITFGVILATLVLQSLTLAPLIRWLRVSEPAGAESMERRARLEGAYAALARLEAAALDPLLPREAIEFLRNFYKQRVQQYTWLVDPERKDGMDTLPALTNALHYDLIEAERRMVIKLRDDGVINDEVLYRIERDLDLQEARLRSRT